MKKQSDKPACQGCDYIEAPILDEGSRYFAEKLRRKQRNESEKNKLEETKPEEKRSGV